MGKPIDKMIAVTLSADNTPVMARPLCPYPQVAKYRGSADVKDTASIACGAE
jgi:hypothetical protein